MQRLRVISWAHSVARDWSGTQKKCEEEIRLRRPDTRRRITESRILKRAKSRGIEPNYTLCGFTMPTLVSATASIPGLAETSLGYWLHLWVHLCDTRRPLVEIQAEIRRQLRNAGLTRCKYSEADQWLRSQADIEGAMDHDGWRRQVCGAWQSARLKCFPDVIRDGLDRLYLVALLHREAVLCNEPEIAESIRKDWKYIVEKAAYVINVRVGCELGEAVAKEFVNGFFEHNIPAEPFVDMKQRDEVRGILMSRKEYKQNSDAANRPSTGDMPWPLRSEYDYEVPMRLPGFLTERDYFLNSSR